MGIKHLKKSILARDRAHAQSTINRNKGTRQLSTIRTGEPALLLDAHSGKWDKRVIIKSVNPSGLSYMVEDQAGNLYSRGRQMLRKRIGVASHSNIPEIPTSPHSRHHEPRRSTRIQNLKVKVGGG